MKSALDYCTILAASPIPEFILQSFELRSCDFHHTLALLSVHQGGFPTLLQDPPAAESWDGSP